MTQEVLKLALEALDNLMYWDNGKPDYDEAREAIAAIKEALREHAMREVQRLGQEIEQEPVAWEQFYPDIGKPQIEQPKVRTGDCLLVGVCASEGHKIQAKQEPWRESASDYERGFIDGMQKQMQSSVDKAVNAMSQPEQEPSGHFLDFAYSDSIAQVHVYDQFTKGQQFYNTPPQRTWVDLTNEDWNEIFDTALNKVEAIKLTKAKLKEKNT